ncbi:MAG: hypothetical protein ACRDIE_09705, partial [Chloroflexota bacterium]
MIQRRSDRRCLLKGAGAAGLVGALGVLQAPTLARAAGAAPSGDQSWSLEGTWISTVALGPGTVFQSLSTYAAGGGVVTTAQAQPRGAAGRPGSVSAHHGTWMRTGALTFQRHVVAFTFDPTGVPTGTHTVDQALVMAEDGQSYDAHGTVTISDLTGKLLQSTSAGT